MLPGPEEAGTEAVVEDGAGEPAGRRGAGAERHFSSCAAQLPASSTCAHVLHRTSISPFSSSTPSGRPISSTLVTDVRSVSLIVACTAMLMHLNLQASSPLALVWAWVSDEHGVGCNDLPTCIRSAAASMAAASSWALLHDGPSLIMASRVLHFFSSAGALHGMVSLGVRRVIRQAGMYDHVICKCWSS